MANCSLETKSLMEFFDLTPLHWGIIGACGLAIGLSKAGIKGLGMIAIPLMAYVFGGKPSVGIILPMLIFADIMAVYYFRRYAEWECLYPIIPWSLAGIVLGTYIGNQVHDDLFKSMMGVIILVSVLILFWRDYRKITTVPTFPGYTVVIGLAIGFTTMVGNLAGPISTLYFLSLQLPKNRFIGTAAWFFLLINISKVPFHVFSWDTITLQTFSLNLCTFPVIALGAWIGVRIVKYIPEKSYRWFIISVTFISALLLFL